MRWWTAFSVVGLGAAGAIGGLLYGVLMVGVPDQNPTPAQAAAEKMNLAIGGWIVGAGLIIFATGLLMLLVLAIMHLVAWFGKPRDPLGRPRSD